ncbi:MAG: murein biosynthesis integral membrane protein MurJ [Alphaproteobacteria bacterium]
MAILKNSLIVSLWTMVSRVLGFARDLLIANKLGAGLASDAFFIALQLPNLLRRLLGEGAFNVAFVPLLAREQAKGHAEAKAFAESVLGWLTVVLVVISMLGVIFMPAVVGTMMPGWVGDADKFGLTVALGRITFPYVLMICLAAFMGAICNTAGRFAAYAMVPSLLNLAFIVGLFALPAGGLEPAYAAAWSVPIGGLAQVAYMVWEMNRAGYRLRLGVPKPHPLLKPMLYRMGPAALGVGVLQLSILLDNFVASWVGDGAVSYLQYANRFYQFPLALIGIAVATVLLPHLSTLLGKGDKAGASQSFMDALMGCLTLAAGATAGLLMLAPELMVTLLHHGAFTVHAAHASAWAMMAFVLGLPAYILTKVTAPAFFANEDAKSPVMASALALGVNLVCNFGLAFGLIHLGYPHVAHVGIAVATAIGGYVNAGLQWYWLRKQGVFVLAETSMVKPLCAMMAVAGSMMLALAVFKLAMPYPMEAHLLLRTAWLAAAITLATGVFVAGVEVTKLLNLRALLASLRHRKQATISEDTI